MPTLYQLGNGTVFSVSTNGGTSYTPVNQLKSISFSGSKLDLEDITNLGSAGATREWAPTLIDEGNATINGVFDPADAGQLAVVAGFGARQLLTCKVVFPLFGTETTSGLTLAFTAYVSERPQRNPETAKTIAFQATFKITGIVTETAGS